MKKEKITPEKAPLQEGAPAARKGQRGAGNAPRLKRQAKGGAKGKA